MGIAGTAYNQIAKLWLSYIVGTTSINLKRLRYLFLTFIALKKTVGQDYIITVSCSDDKKNFKPKDLFESTPFN